MRGSAVTHVQTDIDIQRRSRTLIPELLPDSRRDAKAYDTREEFAAGVTGLLPRSELSRELRAELAEAIAQANQDWSTESKGSGGLELRIGHWFIRDGDLRFFEVTSHLPGESGWA